MAFVINMGQKNNLGAAAGGAIGEGLNRLIERHREDKEAESMGKLYGLNEQETKSLKGLSPDMRKKALDLFQGRKLMDKLFPQEQPQQGAPSELEQRFGQLSPEGQRTGMQAMMGDEMGGPLSQEDALSALREYQGGEQKPPQSQAAPPAQRSPLQGGKITPQHLVAAAGTPYEQPLRSMYDAQERKSTKFEAMEKEPYIAEAKEYFKSLRAKQSSLPTIKSALDAEIDAIKRGDVGPLSGAHFGAIARQMGVPPALAAALETPGSKEFRTAQKTFLTNTLQDTMRGTTSGKQIELVEGLLAEVGASREANLASVWLLKSKALLDEKEIQLATQMRKANVPSYEIADLVAEELEPYRQEISNQYMEAINSLITKKKK